MDDDTQNGGLITRFSAWLKKPFAQDQDAVHWFLFLGLVLVAVFLWSRIMVFINKGVESL